MRLTAAVAREHVLAVEAERVRVRAQKAADEHVGRQLVTRVVFEMLKHTRRDTRDLRELGDRHLPQLALALQVTSE